MKWDASPVLVYYTREKLNYLKISYPSQNCADKKQKEWLWGRIHSWLGKDVQKQFSLNFLLRNSSCHWANFPQQARPITFFNKLYSEGRMEDKKVLREKAEKRAKISEEKPDEKPVIDFFFFLPRSVSRRGRKWRTKILSKLNLMKSIYFKWKLEFPLGNFSLHRDEEEKTLILCLGLRPALEQLANFQMKWRVCHFHELV